MGNGHAKGLQPHNIVKWDARPFPTTNSLVKMSHHTKNEVSMSSIKNLQPKQTHRWTD